MASSKAEAATVVVLENKTRGVFTFQVADERGRLVSEVTVGDCLDKTIPVGIVREPHLCPDPVLRLTAAEYAALGERNHRFIDHLVETGQFERSEAAA